MGSDEALALSSEWFQVYWQRHSRRFLRRLYRVMSTYPSNHIVRYIRLLNLAPPAPTGAPDCNSCGGTFNLAVNQIVDFASPGYPNNPYPNDCQCRWTITAPTGYAVDIRFPQFETEQNYDFVRVYNGNQQVQLENCNGDSCAEAVAESGTMVVLFTSDDSNTFSGFDAYATTVIATTPTTTTLAPCVCGGNIQVNSTSEAYPSSPGWPNSVYPNSCSCVWHVTAAAGEVVSISFEHPFNLEPGADFVRVYDGASTASQEIERCTGNGDFAECQPAYSTGQTMTITFTSDQSDNYIGFGSIVIGAHATTTTTTTSTTTTTTTTPPPCTHVYTVTPGVPISFATPNFPSNYPNSIYCQWTFISQTPGDEVMVNFNSFHTEECCDFVNVYDGQVVDDNFRLEGFTQRLYLLSFIHRLGFFRCSGSSCNNVTAPSGSMVITFRSDDSVNFAGIQGAVTRKWVSACCLLLGLSWGFYR